MKKLNRTGIIFLILHTLIITYLISVVIRSAAANPNSASEGILPAFSMIADQLPFLIMVMLLSIPVLSPIAEAPLFVFGTYYIFGGLQWFVMGWGLSVLLRKDSWKK